MLTAYAYSGGTTARDTITVLDPAEEIRGNGLDDDCDDLVDEQQLAETQYGPDEDNFGNRVPVHFPFEVSGDTSDSGDRDAFHFALGASRRARVTVVDPVVDAASGTIGIRLEVANPKRELPAGTQCSVGFPSLPGGP